ncbi:hypothetical protein BDQ17DRAFT_1235373 [Cyathus striatus]|nr:hypothetical protein BDQ17DRAFT_1235373 [Cyathus striatus]
MSTAKKRKIDQVIDGEPPQDRPTKLLATAPAPSSLNVEKQSKPTPATNATKRPKINKLTPSRPWPTVPTSVNATGPRSSHKEGKNFICITRKTKLAAYMRRCKDIILKDGYKTLHLSAMGAAIPLLIQLSCALPPILPFSRDEIHLEITTGTQDATDEVIPEDEDEDITYRTRSKSTLLIIMKIGDGEFEGDKSGPAKRAGGGQKKGNDAQTGKRKDKGKEKGAEAIVYEEPEQEMMDML